MDDDAGALYIPSNVRDFARIAVTDHQPALQSQSMAAPLRSLLQLDSFRCVQIRAELALNEHTAHENAVSLIKCTKRASVFVLQTNEKQSVLSSKLALCLSQIKVILDKPISTLQSTRQLW